MERSHPSGVILQNPENQPANLPGLLSEVDAAVRKDMDRVCWSGVVRHMHNCFGGKEFGEDKNLSSLRVRFGLCSASLYERNRGNVPKP